MASNYDFRVLINTVSGSNISYGTASLVSVQPNTSLVVNTNTMVDKINTMEQVQVFNGKTHTTASSLFNFKTFPATFFSGSTGVDTNYQYLSASIKGNSESGSILFHANDTPTAGGDFIKRYKFFGNKVCNVLGVPENYWIYADKFRLTNTGSEQNYISGDVLAQSLHLRDNFAISNAGAIESDLPMKHAKDTDRWIKWTDVSSSIPQNDMLIGYSNQNDRYEIRMQNENLLISSSATTASGDFKVGGDIFGNGLILGPGEGDFSQNVVISASDGNILMQGDNDGGDVSLTIRNSAAGGSTDETTSIIFGTGDSALKTPALIRAGREQVYAGISSLEDGFLSFHTELNNAPTEKVRITSDGNMGIGISTPTKPLQVAGDISGSGDIHLEKSLHINTGLNTSEANNHIIINNKIGDENGILFISQSTPYVESVTNSLRIGFSTAGSNNNFFIYDHLQSKTILNYNRDNGFIQINNGDSNITALNSKVVIGNSATAAAINATPSEVLTVSGDVSASGNITAVSMSLGETHTPPHALSVSGSINATDNIFGYLPMSYQFSGRSSAMTVNQEEFLAHDTARADGGTSTLDASLNAISRVLMAPFDGYVKKAFIRCEGTPGDLKMRIYKGAALQNLGDIGGSANRMTSDGVSKDVDIVNISFTLNFDSAPGGDYSFNGGELLAVSVENDTTAAYGDTLVTLVLMMRVQ